MTHPQASTVKEVLVVRNLGVLLGDGTARGEEKTVRHFPIIVSCARL